jgi:hypothetical protein
MAQVTGGILDRYDPVWLFQQCLDQAQGVLQKAADEWALGNPEQPPTKEVLDRILKIFEEQHFLRRTYVK